MDHIIWTFEQSIKSGPSFESTDDNKVKKILLRNLQNKALAITTLFLYQLLSFNNNLS